jgi:hypothetical protein
MINPDNIYHVLPIGDIETHVEKCIYPAIGEPHCNCKCCPEHRRENDGLIIIHNSFDGREVFEQANENLKHQFN